MVKKSKDYTVRVGNFWVYFLRKDGIETIYILF